MDEKQPLLSNGQTHDSVEENKKRGGGIGWRIAKAVLYGVRVVFSTLTAPGRFVIASFYDEEGRFGVLVPLRRLVGRGRGKQRRKQKRAVEVEGWEEEKPRRRRRSPSLESTTSTSGGNTSNDEREDSPARHTRSRTAASISSSEAEMGEGKEGGGGDRSAPRIRIKDNSLLRKRKAPRGSTSNATISEIASSLKSPPAQHSSAAAAALTRYPRSPQTPRPLVPRRQPSYTSGPPLSLSRPDGLPKKTLIIDLDETLIHSMAKGGRMSTGHMVEVKLSYPTSSGTGGQLASGVPILYYVHERPACHEFLRKVAKW